jgi:hypothetical protein
MDIETCQQDLIESLRTHCALQKERIADLEKTVRQHEHDIATNCHGIRLERLHKDGKRHAVPFRLDALATALGRPGGRVFCVKSWDMGNQLGFDIEYPDETDG